MNTNIIDSTDNLRTKLFYHGTRDELKPGDLIKPGKHSKAKEQNNMTSYVYLTPNPDEAIWDAEIMAGEGPGRVYIVKPAGRVEDASQQTDWKSPGHPSMSFRSGKPLRVIAEVTAWLLYHGTKADLKPGDLIKPGHSPNFGNKIRTTKFVYLTRTLDAAVWGAELAVGPGPGRIYIVEPTGVIDDDPNLTDKNFGVIRQSHSAPVSLCWLLAKSRIGRDISLKQSKL